MFTSKRKGKCNHMTDRTHVLDFLKGICNI